MSSSTFSVTRPVWRRFRPQWLSRAAEHVREGGHAAIVDEKESRVDVILTVDEKGKITELGLWALLAIEQSQWKRVTKGPCEGLATARIQQEFVEVVLDWCTRDAMWPEATRVMELDCIACAACCHEANVELEEKDLERFRENGREDLKGRDYVKRTKDGRVTLRFAKNGRCQHLAEDKRCSIYEIRPGNCRAFVAGSEACLAAREDTLDWRDGAPWHERVEVIDMGRKKRR